MSHGDRQSVIDGARSRWNAELAASRPGLDLRGLIDEALDAGGFPRLRSEERAVLCAERPRYRADSRDERSFWR